MSLPGVALGARPLPTRIVMTKADCDDITTRHVLRGRPIEGRVVCPWSPAQAEWSGIGALSGRAADVVTWFRDGQPGAERLGGFQNVLRMRTFQYDLMCAELLASDDVDVTRAVLWHAHKLGRYCVPELEAVAGNADLSVPERVVAWERGRRPRGTARVSPADADAFWEMFADDLTPGVVRRIVRGGRDLPWEVFDRRIETASAGEKDRLLKFAGDLVRSGYAGVGGGYLVRRGVDLTYKLGRVEEHVLSRLFIELLAAEDRKGVEGCEVLWCGVRALGQLEERAAKSLAELAYTARFAPNAARAFYAFARTPLGARRMAAAAGWQRHFQRYCAAALAKKLRNDRMTFLRALAGLTNETSLKHTPFPLVQYLRQGNVTVRVRDLDELDVVLEAWAAEPKAVGHVMLEGDEEF